MTTPTGGHDELALPAMPDLPHFDGSIDPSLLGRALPLMARIVAIRATEGRNSAVLTTDPVVTYSIGYETGVKAALSALWQAPELLPLLWQAAVANLEASMRERGEDISRATWIMTGVGRETIGNLAGLAAALQADA